MMNNVCTKNVINNDSCNYFCYVSVDLSVENLDKPFLYKLKKGQEKTIHVGDKVVFPFGRYNKENEGYVLGIETEDDILYNPLFKDEKFLKEEGVFDKIKYITGLAENKLGTTNHILDLALYMSKEYMTNLSTCIKTCMPVKRHIRKNKRTYDVVERYEKEIKLVDFNEEQKIIIDDLTYAYDNNRMSEHLIHGITGSGKTEVYIELIKHVIKDNKKVIVLIPEISLTYQTVIRLKQVFEEEISIIHSRMSEGEKYLSYKKCLDGKASILVGPRSAIFAPFDDLGLIVIDEVHDHSYKQDVSPRYDTLDIARYRMKRQECMLLTLSATPSVSHYYKALHNDDITIHRLTKRASKNVSLPSISLVDMREEYHNKNKSSFSKTLRELIAQRLENKEQVMLFMNKRGLSRFEKCLDCGETVKCPHCDVSLVVHNDGKAKCHYCGYEENIATTCPKCLSDHIISFGMGTERLEQKCKEEFPNARILRMDRDTTLKKGGMDSIIKDFRNNKADILIGTQMIVKGHDFPNVTLVGIMCADMSLYMPTYKATEDTFSMITQMAGRSGRQKQGDSVIQTYDIDNYAIKCAISQDYGAFYKKEIEYREKLNYPPFCTMLTCLIKCLDEDYLMAVASDIKIELDKNNNIGAIIYGAHKATPYKVKDIYRRMFYIKCKEKKHAYIIRKFLHDKIKEKDYQKSIGVIFDIE